MGRLLASGVGMKRSGVATLLILLPGLMALCACGSGHPASTKSTAGAVSRPAISVPATVPIGASFTQVFATALPANAAQADVIEGFREAEVLWTRSEIAGRLVAPVTEYVTGAARTNLNDALAGLKAHGVVPAGEDRLFMTRVTAVSARSATVTTCDDGSKFREAFASTGKIDSEFTAPEDQDYIFEIWRMAQVSGHWAITSFSLAFLPSASAKPCQP
jgi:hypothetical protein